SVVNSEGIVAPGFNNTPGTLTINGNYTQNNGILRILLASSQASSLEVTGAVNIEGNAALEVIAAPGNYSVGQSFDILKAEGGITGEFSNTTITGGQFTPDSGYYFELE